MLVLILILGLTQGPTAPPACEGVAEFRVLAAWAGEWDVGRVVYERTSQQPGGATRHHRMTLAPENGQVIQTGEHSDDVGKTWSRDFQLTYTRKAP